MVGIYGIEARGDCDHVFIVDVKEPDSYFSSGDWKKNVKEREHKSLVRLSTIAEINELLETGKLPQEDRTVNVMYSTRGALMSLKPDEIRN